MLIMLDIYVKPTIIRLFVVKSQGISFYLKIKRNFIVSVINITDDNFETEVLKSDLPVLVDFWAEWCGPCKVLGPIIDEVAPEYDGKIKFTKLNIDQNPATAPNYQIRGIPTILIFKNGELKATSVGVLSKTELNKLLDENL